MATTNTTTQPSANGAAMMRTLAQKHTAAGAVARPQGKTLREMVEQMSPAVKAALPAVMTPERFTRIALSALSANPALQKSTPQSFLAAMMTAAQLGLEPNTPLGQAYLIPFKNHGQMECQFQLGYKGYIQLAIRSGFYKKLNVTAIKEGELIRFDPLNEEIEVNIIEDEDKREATPTIGYYAMFEYHNGFKKVMYWSKEKMICHADKFSAAFSKEATKGRYPKVSYADFCEGKYDKKDAWLYSSFWYQNFDEMGVKTMMRQLLSKWGILSIEMEKAFSADGGVVHENGVIDYVDSPTAAPQAEQQPTVTVEAEVVQEAPKQPDPMPEPPMPDEPPFVDDDDFASLMG
jgi:recombination protein RecT